MKGDRDLLVEEDEASSWRERVIDLVRWAEVVEEVEADEREACSRVDSASASVSGHHQVLEKQQSKEGERHTC